MAADEANTPMKTVVYSCPFVPAEWIAAHGLRPKRIIPAIDPDFSPSGLTQGLCPYADAFTREATADPRNDAILFTTVCDQMRRIPETLPFETKAPLFVLNVPTTWEGASVHKLYRTELVRLGRFLCELGGTSPSREKLSSVVLDHDRRRSDLRSLRGRVSARCFSEAIARFHRGGSAPVDPAVRDGSSRAARTGRQGVSIALAGGPILQHHFDLFDIVEDAGGVVVLDATGSGERTLPPPVDRRLAREDPLAALADAYFGRIPDAFRRPNSGLYLWLKREFADRGVEAILYVRHTWCDTWQAEARRMKEWCGLPLLSIESGGDSRVDGRTLSRIQSFMEVCSER